MKALFNLNECDIIKMYYIVFLKESESVLFLQVYKCRIMIYKKCVSYLDESSDEHKLWK